MAKAAKLKPGGWNDQKPRLFPTRIGLNSTTAELERGINISSKTIPLDCNDHFGRCSFRFSEKMTQSERLSLLIAFRNKAYAPGSTHSESQSFHRSRNNLTIKFSPSS
jgi:hypothetical protein